MNIKTNPPTIDRSRYPRTDSQKGKLYEAERATQWPAKPGVAGWTATTHLPKDEAEKYVQRAYDWLVTQDRVDRDRGRISFQHSRGQGGAWANRGRHRIMLTSNREPWLLLHEVAHLAPCSRAPGYDGDLRSHGWCFADHYLALVQHFLGVDAAKALRQSFKDRKVRYRPKRRSSNKGNPNLPKRQKATEVYVARYVPTTAKASDAHVAHYLTTEETYVYSETAHKVISMEKWRRGACRGKPLFRVSRESLLKSLDRIHWETEGDAQQFRIVRVPRSEVERDEADIDFWAAFDEAVR